MIFVYRNQAMVQSNRALASHAKGRVFKSLIGRTKFVKIGSETYTVKRSATGVECHESLKMAIKNQMSQVTLENPAAYFNCHKRQI